MLSAPIIVTRPGDPARVQISHSGGFSLSLGLKTDLVPDADALDLSLELQRGA